MVANGHGYTLANVRPKSNLALDGKALAMVPLQGEQLALRLGLAQLAGSRKTKLLEAFEAHARGAISNGQIPGMAGIAES
jgi:hypothetical protein